MPSGARRRASRPRRILRRAGTVIVALFTAVGLVATWNFFAGPPGVGHFRDAQSREQYLAAYDEAMALLPPTTSVHDVPTAHGMVRVYEWSSEENREATPLLLLPGRASGTPMWGENLPALLQERRVLAVDSLGDSGKSIQSAPFSSFDEQADPIAEVVRELAPEGVHLIGHSFGGAIAAAYARQHPESVVTLTLLEPVFTLSPPPGDLLFWTMVSSLPLLPAGVRETALEKVGGEETDSASLEEEPLSRMIAAASEGYRAALPQPSSLTDAELAQLTMPVYVAIASHSSLAGGESAAERAEQLAEPTVKTWPHTTHSLPMQAAGELEPELLEFFAEQDQW
ncbi:alpha/beta hydrolase [Brachybacterium sp.]|uniref:alpha/beta fold hydrolase n=1 Tax=Brachybacterium sp. TaxID=1891286 RepID=UPI002ED5EA3A